MPWLNFVRLAPSSPGPLTTLSHIQQLLYMDTILPGKQQAKPMKPLFVDDSFEVLELVRSYFQNELCIDLHTTRDELEVLRLVASKEVDVLIVDNDLRPGSGIDLYAAVRNLDSDIPFVLVALYPPTDRVRRFVLKEGVPMVYKNDMGAGFLESLRKVVMSLSPAPNRAHHR